MNLSDIIRIPNSDITGVMCLSNGGTVYVRESAVTKIAEENHIQDINALCSFIIEQNGFNPDDYHCMIVKDVKSPLIMENTYIVSEGDSLLDLIGFAETYMDLVPYMEADYVEMKPSQEYTKIMNQKIGLFYEKIDAIVRKVDYDEPAEIKRRIGKCDDAIKRLKTEYDAVHNRKKDKAGDKRDMHQYNAVTIIKALTNIATAFISVNVGNALHDVFKNVVSPKVSRTGHMFANQIRAVGQQKGQPEFANKAAKIYDKATDKLVKGVEDLVEYRNKGKYMIASIMGNLSHAVDKMMPAPDYERSLVSYINQIQNTKAFLEKAYQKSMEKQKSKEEKKKESPKKESSIYAGPSIQDIMHETGSYWNN